MRLDVLLCPECLQPSPIHDDTCGRPGHEVVAMMPVFEHQEVAEAARYSDAAHTAMIDRWRDDMQAWINVATNVLEEWDTGRDESVSFDALRWLMEHTKACLPKERRPTPKETP